MIALQLHRERLRIAEQRAVRQELATGELREQFIAVLGHYLRNPWRRSAWASRCSKKSPPSPASSPSQAGSVPM
jgi:hypothetical protein